MKWRTGCGAALFISILAVIVVLTVPASRAHATSACSNAVVRGQYLRTVSGTITGLGPFVTVGVFTADGQGNMEGKLTTVRNGAAVEETLTGTYAVDSDCTGTETLVTGDGRIVINNMVVSGLGNEYFAVTTNIPVVTAMVHAKRQFPSHGLEVEGAF
jgi:hypothetical protein